MGTGKAIITCMSFLLLVVHSKYIKKADDLPSFGLDDYLRGRYSNRGWNGSWISDTSFMFRNSSGAFLEFDVETKTSSLFLNSSILSNYSGASFGLSPDKSYLLIKYNSVSIYRYTTLARYAIYDFENDTYYDIADKNQLSLVRWSPTGKSFAFVLDNDIHYVSSPEDVTNPVRITTDGENGVVYNGVPDWVYEEEVYGTDSAMWFSPDGNALAFASFNDYDVEGFTYFIYGDAGTIESQYPHMETLKYPKVGRTNPNATLNVAYLHDSNYTVKTLDALVPEEYLPVDYIIFSVSWATNEEVSVVVTNRVQNSAVLRRCHISTGECRTERSFSETKGWLDLQAPRYHSNGQSYIMILPQPEGDDTFRHLIHSTTEGNLTRLTKGERVVTSIYGWDQSKNLVYYGGSVEGFHNRQQVYVVDLNTLEDACITCDYVVANGENCPYTGGSFSTNFSYFAKVCQGLGPYYTTVQKIENANDVFVWQDNELLRNQLANISQPVVKDVEVDVEGGFVAKVRMYLPPELDEGASVKYPAIVQVYAGPDSVRIADTYGLGFREYIVTDRKYIWISIDARGSGRRGDNLMFQVYRNLATVEIEDQINVTKYLQQTYAYIDANKTGIWGWSYGGFAAAWALVKDTENVFNNFLSVAPVTSFIYYDSIYTERYMGLPTEDDNLGGYNGTDLTRHADAFRDRNFLLIHGNADDNVHYQQSMLLEKALVAKDVEFEQINYPDEAHSLSRVSPHLYHSIDRFWARSFGLPDPPKTDYS